mmetsp:Transcript_15298/g.36878  ORF Transcript_15298/g.36878 Transcript_15298/m.36878 type:complete len:456 (+) Transcript_15298:974-2341(+)
MQLTATSDHVLTVFTSLTNNQGIRLRQLLQPFDKLREILAVLGPHGYAHDRRHTVLHLLDVVGSINGGDGRRLQDELVQPNQPTSVPGRHICNRFHLATHLQHSPLDVANVQIRAGSREIVWSLDAHLLAGGDSPREHATESKESSLVRRGNHLRHVQHQSAFWVASLDGSSRLVIPRSFVEGLATVLLRRDRRGQMCYNHCKQGLRSVHPDLHDSLHQRLSGQFLVIAGQLHAQGPQHLLSLCGVPVHHGVDHLRDWNHDELTERSVNARLLRIGPLLLLRNEPPITPQSPHHLRLVDTKLGSIQPCESLQVEGPLVQTGTERHCPLPWVHLLITHRVVLVGGNDDVHILNRSQEPGVHVLRSHLQLEDAPVHLVHEQYWLHSLRQGLAKHSLRLNSAALNSIYDDQRPVSHSQCSGHFRGKIDVPRRVDQVDQKLDLAPAIVKVVREIQRHTG